MDMDLPTIHLDYAALAALYEAHDAECEAADEADAEAARICALPWERNA